MPIKRSLTRNRLLKETRTTLQSTLPSEDVSILHPKADNDQVRYVALRRNQKFLHERLPAISKSIVTDYGLKSQSPKVEKKPPAKGFTLKGKHKVSCLLEGIDPSIPPLGSYDPKVQLNSSGKYPLAKYQNSKQITFGQRTDKVMYKRLCKCI